MALWNVVDGLSIYHRLFWLVCMFSRCLAGVTLQTRATPAVVFNYLCACLLIRRLLFHRLFLFCFSFGCVVLAYFIVCQYVAAAATTADTLPCAPVRLPLRPSVRPSRRTEQSSNDKNGKKNKIKNKNKKIDAAIYIVNRISNFFFFSWRFSLCRWDSDYAFSRLEENFHLHPFPINKQKKNKKNKFNIFKESVPAVRTAPFCCCFWFSYCRPFFLCRPFTQHESKVSYSGCRSFSFFFLKIEKKCKKIERARPTNADRTFPSVKPGTPPRDRPPPPWPPVCLQSFVYLTSTDVVAFCCCWANVTVPCRCSGLVPWVDE